MISTRQTAGERGWSTGSGRRNYAAGPLAVSVLLCLCMAGCDGDEPEIKYQRTDAQRRTGPSYVNSGGTQEAAKKNDDANKAQNAAANDQKALARQPAGR